MEKGAIVGIITGGYRSVITEKHYSCFLRKTCHCQRRQDTGYGRLRLLFEQVSSTHMATNGESAAQWLSEHGETTPLERLQQIRDNIATRLEDGKLDDEQHIGLLEALDVMDSYIITKETSTTGSNPIDITPDLSPLCDNSAVASPIMPEEERKKRFSELLKTGKLPSVIS